MPVYKCLSDRGLLLRCLRGNPNPFERLHLVISNLISNEQHSFLFAVQAAVAEAVLCFNKVNKHSAIPILQELGMNVTSTGEKTTPEKDVSRSAMSSKRHASSEGLGKKESQRSTKITCIPTMPLGHFE